MLCEYGGSFPGIRETSRRSASLIADYHRYRADEREWEKRKLDSRIVDAIEEVENAAGTDPHSASE